MCMILSLIHISQLPDMLKEKGANLSTDPEAYLNSYLGYKMEPNKDLSLIHI